MWCILEEGKGGNISDIVMILNSCDILGALQVLSAASNQSFSFSPAPYTLTERAKRKVERSELPESLRKATEAFEESTINNYCVSGYFSFV